MPFQKVQPEKLSTSVVRQIEQLICEVSCRLVSACRPSGN